MLFFRWSRFRKFISLFGLFIIVVFLLLTFNKIPRIFQKLPEMVDSTKRTIAWSLSPTVVVKVGDNALTKALPKIRSASATGPLRVNPANPRYFTDGSGKAIFLTGSHTWDNRQDMGSNIFDYDRYLNLLQQYNHNFVRLYVWEQPKGITTGPDPAKPLDTLTPEIFARSGSGVAADGGSKFDVTRFNQAHFDRLRQRVIEARDRGIYVSVMLFNGWSIEKKAGGANPWIYHPFNKNNNINGIDGDPNNDQSGSETHTLQIPAITQAQEAYIQKAIDTVNNLDNVLYEISNESDIDSQDWQYHVITYIKAYEATKPKQHPVGMTVPFPQGSNNSLFNSPADWISPNGGDYMNDPPAATGKKIIVSDTDHLWGIGGDRVWAWKSFTRGLNPIYMDPWDSKFIPAKPNTDLRVNLGYILSYANRMNLVAMTPRGDLASTDYCLANPTPSAAEYLIYSPTGGTVTVNLSGVEGKPIGEWLNPSNGMITTGISTTSGGNRSFVPPFEGDAVLYIHQESK